MTERSHDADVPGKDPRENAIAGTGIRADPVRGRVFEDDEDRDRAGVPEEAREENAPVPERGERDPDGPGTRAGALHEDDA
ncbi:hypothetical protein [Nocardiopsis lambiniae]|uniref:Uncharacterized protein n=1 Tax=Nocardiopsis lambiniae TaxID=3075539 RepID=A0ABU2MBF7_9ACTN|nr:hypothetical protein [Nocardiopsis sp. DSM 44743]MDT0329450.1 hypothetical protein [Nocardiopsis sp. DSM 44743]